MKKLLLSALGLFVITLSSMADEGMWLLKELNRQSQARMKELGFTFPLDSLYSEKNPSLKDAVVIFGGGCTGVAVSQQGLIFTNHHCGYDDIQKLSTVEHDYLKDGFVSTTLNQELPCKGLEVLFLKKTEDVTKEVLKGVKDSDSDDQRQEKIESAKAKLLEQYSSQPHVKALVQAFYSQNKYFLIVYDVFKDVRLVLTPPSSVGKFGGETDNWIWPRHTGDFSVFRVYADANNQPAEYSPTNVPYRPKYVVPISLKGYQAQDYAMTVGYPGSTQRYLTSWGVKYRVEANNIPLIEVRDAKLKIWNKAMEANDTIRIKYATKYAYSSNYWKNSQGMNQAIKRLHVVEQKEELEQQFAAYLSKNKSKQKQFGQALPLLKEGFEGLQKIGPTLTYFREVFYGGIEIFRVAQSVVNTLNKTVDQEDKKQQIEAVYKDYTPWLDKEVAVALLRLYAQRVSPEYLPSFYQEITEKYHGDYQQYVDELFAQSHFSSQERALHLLSQPLEVAQGDPVFRAVESIYLMHTQIFEEVQPLRADIVRGERLFVGGLMAMNKEQSLSPDANFTQRLSYGTIGGYSPSDGVWYDYRTTTQGVLEKVDPTDPEFYLQDYIVKALESHDFAPYDEEGKLYTCFISNNDITGGNSGSPVFNHNAELIGLAFDGNWEALSGDIVFEKNLQRSINVDIRYVLYIIDKVMKAPHIIQELNIKQ